MTDKQWQMVPVEPSEAMKDAGMKASVLCIKEVWPNGEPRGIITGFSDEDCAAIFTAMLAAAPSPWMPIETEPKDSFPRLYLCHQKVLHGFVDVTGARIVLHELGWRRMRRKPSHWMPLPPRPQA